MSLAVGYRYARALGDIVFAENSPVDPDAVLAEIRSFGDALRASRALRDVFASPAVTAGKKTALIEKLAAGMGFSQITRNFLLVVCRHRRFAILSRIAEAFQAVIDERRGVIPAHVIVAVELDESQKQEFELAVARLTGKKVRLECRVEPAILGGAILRIGSTVYDGSVAGQLRRIGARLAAGS